MLGSISEIYLSHGCEGATPNALFDGHTFKGCISDIECDGKSGHHIFNHFDETHGSLTLVPECRSTTARPMPGFTCGSDPTLEEGTKIVVNNIPTTGYPDDRKITILKSGRYSSLEADLAGQYDCPKHGTEAYCPDIKQFHDGCPSTKIEDGFVVFMDPFNQADCKAKVTDHKTNDEWTEEHKIFVGYDDLVATLPGGSVQVKRDIHKVYEISCKIAKMGDVGTDIELELETDNRKYNDTIGTNFFIEKYFGDINDSASRQTQLTDTDVIPFKPNADPNDRFQFKVYSDHEHEYVHLESCLLTLDGKSGFEQEFINDGCVTDEWTRYFANDHRNQKINEDWFNMRPLLIGCKSKWHIDCTVASCKRGLKTSNSDAYEQFCKADEKCEDRYTSTFFGTNARKRRSPDESDEEPAEDHVKLDLVHPCFYVDEYTTEYCVNEDTCWTLEQCTEAFPDDFSISELDQIMRQFKLAVEEHINEALSSTESPIDTHDQIMENLRDNANQVLNAKQSFDDAIESIIQSINTL